MVRAMNVSPGKTANDEITLVVSGVQFSYDADAGTATFKKDKSSCSIFSRNIAHYAKGVADEALGITKDDSFLKCGAFQIASQSKNLGYAIGQNAFGVKIRYSKSFVSSLILAMPRDDVLLFDQAMTFQTNKARAAQMIGPASMAISGRLLYPYVAYESDYQSRL